MTVTPMGTAQQLVAEIAEMLLKGYQIELGAWRDTEHGPIWACVMKAGSGLSTQLQAERLLDNPADTLYQAIHEAYVQEEEGWRMRE